MHGSHICACSCLQWEISADRNDPIILRIFCRKLELLFSTLIDQANLSGVRSALQDAQKRRGNGSPPSCFSIRPPPPQLNEKWPAQVIVRFSLRQKFTRRHIDVAFGGRSRAHRRNRRGPSLLYNNEHIMSGPIFCRCDQMRTRGKRYRAEVSHSGTVFAGYRLG